MKKENIWIQWQHCNLTASSSECKYILIAHTYFSVWQPSWGKGVVHLPKIKRSKLQYIAFQTTMYCPATVPTGQPLPISDIITVLKFKESLLWRGFHTIGLRTEAQLAYKCRREDFHCKAKYECWRGSVLCSLYKVNGFLKLPSVLVFCNIGRATHEKEKQCTFWIFPSFAKTACFCPDIQKYTSLPFPFSWSSPIQNQNETEGQARKQETSWRQTKPGICLRL